MLRKNSFNAPAVNKSIIRRKTLISKLEPAQERRLTLISAPAGYGKTTAVFDWLNHCGLPAVWLSLNAYNSAPSAFWKGVCHALDDIIPGIWQSLEYLLSSQELLNANIQIDMFTDVISASKRDFALVLDDMHLISDPSTLKGLSHFIDYLPANLHLLLISRTEPELELAKYRIKWQMQTINAADLRFQRDDIFQFYQARGLHLDVDEIEQLEKHTEGWAASLVAIAMSLEKDQPGRITSDALPSLNGNIDHYLNNEVLSDWTEEKCAFAMKTSILDTLSEAVCNAVTGEANANRILMALYRENGFLAELDEQGHEYRFHHLFRDFMSKRLIEIDPALVSELHARAGFWYQENHSIDRAVEHFLNAGLYDEALELIECKDVHHLFDNSVLFSWINRLPKRLRDTSFKCAYIFSLYYAEIERYDLARDWGERMQTLATLPKYASNPESAAFCGIACVLNETNLLLRVGDPRYLVSLISVFEQFDPRYYKMPEFIDFNPSDIYCYRSPISYLIRLFSERKDDYETFANNYRGLIFKKPGYKTLVAGEYLYECDKPDEALPYLLDAMEEARTAGCMGALVPTMVGIARVRRVAGDYKGAFKALAECKASLHESGKLHWNQMVSAMHCRLLIDSGETTGVDLWISTCRIDIYSEISRIREFEFIVYARALIFKDHLADAELLLQRLLAFTAKTSRPHSRVEVLNLLAALTYQRGERSKACAYLDQSITIGREQGYIRSYLDEGKAMANLLAVYSKARVDETNPENAGFTSSLLQKIRKEQASVTIQEGPYDCLSPREREVFYLLLEASSNREISEQMGITLQAVKFHLGNIYSKLGVKTRAQCLTLARKFYAK